MRTLTNLLLIFVLCFAAFGINVTYAPLALTSENFETTDDISAVRISTDSDTENFSGSLSVFFENPPSITYFVSSVDNLFTLELLDGETSIFTEEVVPVEDESRPYEYTFDKEKRYEIPVNYDFSSSTVSNYKLRLSSNFDESIQPLKFEFSHDSPYTYIPSKTAESIEKYMTVYVPDASYSYSVPISLQSTELLDSLTDRMKFLQKPINGFKGLAPIQVLGEFNYGVVKKDTLYLDLKSSDPLYNASSAPSMMRSILNTFALYYDEPIQFLVDFNKKGTFFSGQSIREPFVRQKRNVSYHLLKGSGRDYLVDVPVSIAPNAILEEKVKALVDNLKQPIDNRLMNVLETDFTYNGVVLLDGTLSFNISEQSSLSPWQVDAIGFTLLSMPEVNTVDLRKGSQTIKIFNRNEMINTAE
ncbi:MAG: hypothetical protein N4A40_14020 [Tissierellales bacterium]|jgi:hypothetical protein|nr:hypothetical protein [Tissierellales bacterium]